MQRLTLFLKGVCMGIADVIPGVSGGTLALILGVYKELVDTIKGLNLRFVPPLVRFLKHRTPENREALIASLRELNLAFLVTLGAGIAVALAIGSVIIPYLLENFPVQTRAFFFGLIVASVWVPFRMIDFEGPKTGVIVLVTAVAGVCIGWIVTNPATTLELTRESYAVTSSGESLKDVTRRGPSALPSAEVFWSADNQPLRDSVRAADPTRFAALQALHDADAAQLTDKDAIKARSSHYDDLHVPEGTVVNVPRPTLWFVFIAGMIAICAMILPGISGSYILLILGAYFFILNALKGFLQTLASAQIPVNQGLFVFVFCAGCAIGILSFSRVLSYLLSDHPVPTLGILVGLMVGCLRGIWPFRATVDGVITNVMPTAGDPVGGAVATFVVGLVLVAAFGWLGRKRVDAVEAEL